MATTRRRRLGAVAASLAIILACWPATVASAADEVAFVIKDSRITESSGLARDTKADLYWTVNDSGDEGTVYGLTPQGLVQGVVGFRVKPKDVEAVAMFNRTLYVADIGDNRSARDFVTVYYFDNLQANNRTVPYRAYDFSYPDGPHDAETLLVDGGGRLYIVTKGIKGGVYSAPKSPSRHGVNKLKRVAGAPPFVTDGVFLPDGEKIALRTYVSVEMLDAKSYKTVARAATPVQRQGESIAVTLDGRSLLLGSEGERSSVFRMAVPTAVGAAPAPSSSPPATNQATPTPTASESDPAAEDDPTDEQDAGPTRRSGTLLALSLAAFVALVAGVVVVAVRKPG